MSILHSDHFDRGYSQGFEDAMGENKRRSSGFQALFGIDKINFVVGFDDAYDSFVQGYNAGYDAGLSKKKGVYSS